MKQFLTIFIATLLLLPSFGKLAVYTQFKINQEEISKTICVQRKLVNNTCNGRCELQKSLKKLDENQNKMNRFEKEKTELVYIQNTENKFVPIVFANDFVANNYFELQQKPIGISLSNFRPPSC